MRRRIWLSALLSTCLLALVAGSALAAGGKTKTKSKTGKVTTTKVACATATSVMIPAGESSVSPPASQGTEYGTARCAGLGSGVQKDAFTVPGSGDTVATFALYFGTGTLHGTYDLTPQSGSLNFLETDWMGTMKVLGGTGADKGVTGTGTMVCKTLDGIHSTCTDKLVLKMPAAKK